MSPKQRRRIRTTQILKFKTGQDAGTAPVAQPEPSVPSGGNQTFPERRRELGLSVVVFAAFLIIYILTASRSVPTGDSGELITAAWTLGVAHPPGYPTFTLLSHLAGYLPLGNPAFRLNLLSAFLDALALGILFWGTLRFFRSEQERVQSKINRLIPLVGTIAGIGLLGVSRVFWLYSTVAEVFALNNLFSAITLVLFLEWVRQPVRKKYLYLGGLFAGLAMTNQHTFVLLAPGLLVLLVGGIVRWRRNVREGLVAGKSKKQEPGWLISDIAVTAGFFILGLLPYLYLPIAAGADPPYNWGNPATFSGFWQVLTRSDYGTFSFTANGVQGNPFQQLFYLGRYILQGFSVAGILLAVLGIVWFARKRPLEGCALGLLFIFSGPIFAMVANPAMDDPLTLGVFERFYILPGIPLACFIAAGAVYLVELAVKAAARFKSGFLRWAPCAAGLLAAAAMVIIVALVQLPSIQLSNNRIVEYYAEDLLGPLEPDALLIVAQDYNGSALIYAQLVSSIRTDVVALHSELLKSTWYCAQQRRLHPQITIPFNNYDGGIHNSLADLIKANIGQRPVYAAGIFKEDLTKTYDEVYWGLSRRFVEKGRGTDQFALMKTESARFAGLRYPDKAYPQTFWEYTIAEQYGQAAFIIATALSRPEAQPDADLVERLYRIAILNNPVNPSSYKNLGILLWMNGGSSAEIIELWERYLQMAPNDPDNANLRSTIAKLKEVR
jgi:hypothetical protein